MADLMKALEMLEMQLPKLKKLAQSSYTPEEMEDDELATEEDDEMLDEEGLETAEEDEAEPDLMTILAEEDEMPAPPKKLAKKPPMMK